MHRSSLVFFLLEARGHFGSIWFHLNKTNLVELIVCLNQSSSPSLIVLQDGIVLLFCKIDLAFTISYRQLYKDPLFSNYMHTRESRLL